MSVFNRLVAGPGQLQAQEYDEWNQLVGTAPPEHFGWAAYEAVRQTDPRASYEHT